MFHLELCYDIREPHRNLRATEIDRERSLTAETWLVSSEFSCEITPSQAPPYGE